MELFLHLKKRRMEKIFYSQQRISALFLKAQKCASKKVRKFVADYKKSFPSYIFLSAKIIPTYHFQPTIPTYHAVLIDHIVNPVVS